MALFTMDPSHLDFEAEKIHKSLLKGYEPIDYDESRINYMNRPITYPQKTHYHPLVSFTHEKKW